MSAVDSEIATILLRRDAGAADVLGPRAETSGGVRILAWLPGATAVTVIPAPGEIAPQLMVALHADGLFEARFPTASQPFAYVLRVQRAGGISDIADPYAFAPSISDLDLFTIGEGTNLLAFEVLGAHPRAFGGVTGVHFAVWAPHARWLSVIGDFNAWDTRIHPLRRRGDGGIWEIFIPGVTVGAHYKFHIESLLDGYMVDKSDPYAFQAEVRPLTASIVTDLHDFVWGDDAWLACRAQSKILEAPVSIYEVHLGSWRRADDGGLLNYRDLAHDLVDYVKSVGFTHIELMPVTEHPFDVSWGYQTTGYYAPTSRFGTPADFMYFVDYCHRHDVGVFLDWVPSHFAKEGHGLGFFDGAHIYEHADPRQGEHFDWGTYVFNYGRGEVLTFLLSNAVYWLQMFHIDGMRVDAVASMLYLDHQRPAGAWIPNRYGGRENLEAVEFLRRFNVAVHERFPGVTTMAEESTSWPMVSRPVYLGGLGFTMKWNMGWMHDTLEYVKADPIYRRFIHNTLTFSMMYNYSENFLLPLSHDEVVHGKSPLVYKAPGDEWRKFATLRLLFGYMWAHPGKKLLFMGGDFAQTTEWQYDAALQWRLLAYPAHQGAQDWVKALNALYASRPALYELDYDPAGFEWIDCKDVDNSIFIIMRRGRPDPARLLEIDRMHPVPAESHPAAASLDANARAESTATDVETRSVAEAARRRRQNAVDEARPFIIFACSFTPVVRHGYVVGMPFPGRYREILNSDDTRFGGSGVVNEGTFATAPIRVHEREQAITITLPPLGVAILEYAGA